MKGINPFKALALFLIFVCSSGIILAQNGTVTGSVKDADGNGLANASVIVQAGKAGTRTNADGTFSLSLPAGTYVLIASFTGKTMDKKTVKVVSGESISADFALANAGDLEGLMVIGSRSLSRTKTQTAVPVDVIPLEQVINDVGQIDLNQILNYVAPSFQSARQTVADGTDHVDPAQLRGLGTDQVLVLINGKRRHQSALVNVNGTVNRGQVSTDLSAIPPSAVERIEILRDGAAAQYGSDAIAGVINLVLKKKVNVLTGDVSVGQYMTTYEKNYAYNITRGNKESPDVTVNDGEVVKGALNYGFSLGNKGFLNLSAEASKRNPTNRTGTYTDVIYPGAAAYPAANYYKDDSIMGRRGQTRNTFDMRIGTSQMKTVAGFINGDYKINADWDISWFGGYSQKKGDAAGTYRYPNAFGGASGNGGIYKAQILALYPNGFLPLIQTDIKDYSFSAGINGKLGGWVASLSNTFGTNEFDYHVANSINYSQFAVTAIPQTEFDAGGIKNVQNTINLDATRKFSVMEGLNFAWGSEFRTESYGQTAGEEASYKNYNTAGGAAAGAQVFAGFLPDNAGTHSRSAFSLYTDVELDLTKKLQLGGALRFENYSDFGTTLNYKGTALFNVVENFSLRGSVSSGFRAPSMQQRFYARTSTLFITDPVTSQLVPVQAGTFTNDSKPAQILGIPKLKEETSQNYSVGFTTKPLKGLEITMDAYLVDIKDRIILTNNFTGGNDPVLQAQLNATGASTANFFSNAVDTKAQGLETVISYATKFGNHSIKATLASSLIKNEVDKNDTGRAIIHASEVLVKSGQLQNYFNREDQSRFEVASPKSKTSFMLNYKYEKFGVMLRLSHFGKVIYMDGVKFFAPNITLNQFNGLVESTDQEFKPKTTTDITLSYEFAKQLTVSLGSQNIFDVYQDRHHHSSNMAAGRFVYSRRVSQMGYEGRYVFARVAFNIGTK
jgi:iron complex outermembrane receptor protein